MSNELQTLLIGDPVEHSLSDHMYEIISRKVKYLNYKHIKSRVDSSNLLNLKEKMKELRSSQFLGANITIPYKLSVIPFIDEIDDDSKIMGAVNTVVNRDGILSGYNTDGYGAVRSIEYKLCSIQNKNHILIIGSGGAARAIVQRIYSKCQNITILNREVDYEIVEKLASDLRKSGIEIKHSVLNKLNLLPSRLKSTHRYDLKYFQSVFLSSYGFV